MIQDTSYRQRIKVLPNTLSFIEPCLEAFISELEPIKLLKRNSEPAVFEPSLVM